MLKKILTWMTSWWTKRRGAAPLPLPVKLEPPPPTPLSLSRLERIVLTEQVARTLFDDFAAHRRTERGDEEIGWMLLGLRQGAEAIALATLPAGARRDAGAAHVLFNSDAQALASRIVRQGDKRLVSFGMVHTHPGSLRHPSSGDYRGDIDWVQRLRGGEGVFGIGTADVGNEAPAAFQQIEGELLFSWYALGQGDKTYRRLPVALTPGADLARPLHPIWDTVEQFALPLERLVRQLAGIAFEAIGATLVVTIKLAEPNQRLRIVLQNDEARYYVEQGSQASTVDPEEPSLERAVFLILAELAKPAARAATSADRR